MHAREPILQKDTGHRGFNKVARWILMFLSAWFVVGSLFAAGETEAGVLNLIQTLQAGAPAGLMVVPLVGAISLFLLWRQAPGTYWLLTAIGFIAGGIVLFTLDEWQAASLRVEPGLGLALSMPAGFIYSLLAVLAAMGAPVPMGSPLVRLLYMGRYRHLQDLCSLAKRWGWIAAGSLGLQHALVVDGEWRGRHIHIISGYAFERGYYLHLDMLAQTALWPVFAGHIDNKPGKKYLEAAIKGVCHNAKGREIPLYLWHPSDKVVDETALQALQEVISSGGRLLRRLTGLSVHHHSIVLSHGPWFVRKENAQDVEGQLEWLGRIADTMEKHGLVIQPAD